MVWPRRAGDVSRGAAITLSLGQDLGFRKGRQTGYDKPTVVAASDASAHSVGGEWRVLVSPTHTNSSSCRPPAIGREDASLQGPSWPEPDCRRHPTVVESADEPLVLRMIDDECHSANARKPTLRRTVACGSRPNQERAVRKRCTCMWRPEYLDDRAFNAATFAVHDRNGRRVRRGVLREPHAGRDGACKRPSGQQQPRPANRTKFVLERQTSLSASRCSHSRSRAKRGTVLGLPISARPSAGRATLPGALGFGAGRLRIADEELDAGSPPASGADWHRAEAARTGHRREPKRRQGDVPAVNPLEQAGRWAPLDHHSTLTDRLSLLNGGRTKHEKAQVNLSLISPP